MNSRKHNARLAGALYVAMGLPGAFTLVYIPSAFFVRGDAAATAQRIAASPMLYRMGVLCELLSGAFAVWLVMVLYDVFKDVDRALARVMVGLVLVMIAMGFATTLVLAAPIVLTSGARYLSAFDKQQLDALTLGALDLRNQGIRAVSMYWGLWLLPLGALVYRSRLLPQIIGVLVIAAGASYIVTCLTYFFFPRYGGIVTGPSTVLQAAGEGGFAFWMLIKGVKENAA
jgi:Domain of unknown function (DUF4386)